MADFSVEPDALIDISRRFEQANPSISTLETPVVGSGPGPSIQASAVALVGRLNGWWDARQDETVSVVARLSETAHEYMETDDSVRSEFEAIHESLVTGAHDGPSHMRYQVPEENLNLRYKIPESERDRFGHLFDDVRGTEPR